MDFKIREIDERDFKFIEEILSDLYNSLNKDYTENIFVVQDENSLNYVIKENNYYLIYKPYLVKGQQEYIKIKLKVENQKIIFWEDNQRKISIINREIDLENKRNQTGELITYQDNTDYYGFNGIVIYSKTVKDGIVQLVYPYNIFDNFKIYKYWMKNPTHIYYQNISQKVIYEYCTIDNNFFTYLYHSLRDNKLSDFLNLLFNLNIVNDMEGFYIKTPFKLGKKYNYEDLQKLVDINGPSEEIINIFNNEDKELNYIQEVINAVLKYIDNRGENKSRIYFKND